MGHVDRVCDEILHCIGRGFVGHSQSLIVPFSLGPSLYPTATSLDRFGSRVDVYLDDPLVPQVMVGQKAVAGETVLALADGIRAERREDGI